jgi:hypothetical protein
MSSPRDRGALKDVGIVSYYTVGIDSSVTTIRELAKEADGLRLTFDGGAYYEWSYEDGYFYPELGSAYLLATLVPLRPLSPTELLGIANITVNCSISMRYNNKMPQDYSYFSTVRTVSYVDYSAIISELEKVGLVRTDKSSNILCLDERKFTLVSDDRIEGSLREYIGTSYDVDVLGTSLFEELSLGMKHLYRTTFKKELSEEK